MRADAQMGVKLLAGAWKLDPWPGECDIAVVMKPIDEKTTRWFAGLWGLGFLFHYESLYRTDWHELPYTAFPLMAMGAILVFRPRLTGMFFAACVLHTFEVVAKTYLERVHVSWFIAGSVSATIAYTWVRHGGSAASVLERSVPTIRAIVLVLYFFAVFHKLNAGYFSPEHGFPAARVAKLPLVGHVQVLVDNAAVLGLMTEALVGILLAFPRSRFWGVVLGGSFHGALGYTAFSQFAYLYPLYMVFLEPPAGRIFTRFWGRVLPRARRPAWLVLAVFLVASEQALGVTGASLRQVVWSIGLLCGAISLFVYYRATRSAEPSSSTGIAFGKGPIALFVWCFMPYFGLMSHPCVAMYSHLRIDSGISNHFIVPAFLQVSAIHGDLARIESVAPRRTRVTFPPGREVPHQALRHWVRRLAADGRAPKRLVYSYRGEQHEVLDGKLETTRWLDYLPVLDFNYRFIVRNERDRLQAAQKQRRREKKRRQRAK